MHSHMLPEKFHSQYETYLADWMRAEEVLKITERIKNEAFIPSIMELRYAARRVVQATVDCTAGRADETQISAHLTEAIENCRKARHDAVDSAINFVHEQLNQITTQVGLATLCAAFPNYSVLKAKIKKIDERIVASRKERHTLDEEYETIKREHLVAVVDMYHELECSQPAIAAIQKKQRKDFLVGVVIVGLLVGIMASTLVVVADKKGAFDGFTAQRK